MKKIITILFVIILLALDFAALDDITTGNEPNYTGEYLMLFTSVIIFAVLLYLWRKNRQATKK